MTDTQLKKYEEFDRYDHKTGEELYLLFSLNSGKEIVLWDRLNDQDKYAWIATATEFGEHSCEGGYEDGIKDGFDDGYNIGKYEGYNEGSDEGYTKGYDDGYDDGKYGAD